MLYSMSCLLLILSPYSHYIIEGKIGGVIEVTGIQGRSHKQQLNDLKETRGYWKLKAEELDRTLENSLLKGYGSVVRHGMNESLHKGEGACVLSPRKPTLFSKT